MLLCASHASLVRAAGAVGGLLVALSERQLVVRTFLSGTRLVDRLKLEVDDGQGSVLAIDSQEVEERQRRLNGRRGNQLDLLAGKELRARIILVDREADLGEVGHRAVALVHQLVAVCLSEVSLARTTSILTPELLLVDATHGHVAAKDLIYFLKVYSHDGYLVAVAAHWLLRVHVRADSHELELICHRQHFRLPCKQLGIVRFSSIFAHTRRVVLLAELTHGTVEVVAGADGLLGCVRDGKLNVHGGAGDARHRDKDQQCPEPARLAHRATRSRVH